MLERARNDGNETVRSEAVRTLGVWPNQSELTGDLRAIAKQDSAQSVRYEAERVLFRAGAH